MEQTLFDQVLPYAGTSGYSGSETSRERAERNDRDGTTMRHQVDVMTVLRSRGADGMNWREVGDRLNLHHGSASSVLSNLHKAGYLARLKERRDRCAIYVLPEFVNGRKTSDYKPNAAHARHMEFVAELREMCLVGDFSGVYDRVRDEHYRLASL